MSDKPAEVMSYICVTCGNIISLEPSASIRCRTCGSRILNKTRSKKHEIEKLPYSHPFRQPVDWKELGLTDYIQIIKNPMDLSTIRFTADLKLIWDNCRAFNGCNTDIYEMANKMEAESLKIIEYHVMYLNAGEMIDCGVQNPNNREMMMGMRSRPYNRQPMDKHEQTLNISESKRHLLVKFANRLMSLPSEVANVFLSLILAEYEYGILPQNVLRMQMPLVELNIIALDEKIILRYMSVCKILMKTFQMPKMPLN